MDTETIPSRFKAPPKSAKGGYVRGLMALRIEGDATVVGRDLSGAGRKRRCGTAVFAPDGSLVARAEGLRVVVDPSSITG